MQYDQGPHNGFQRFLVPVYKTVENLKPAITNYFANGDTYIHQTDTPADIVLDPAFSYEVMPGMYGETTEMNVSSFFFFVFWANNDANV
jgi:hypothetical protein